MLTWLSHSEEQTYRLGKRIGENIKPGDIILLFGELGSGKTVLSRVLPTGSVLLEWLPVPFTLMNTYVGRIPVYHFDIYRLSEPEELYDLDYEDYFLEAVFPLLNGRRGWGFAP